jgi:hypothetical protein
MKLMISCSECNKTVVESPEDARKSISLVEYNNDGVFKTICPRGHETTTVLQQLRYETLFEIGAHAIIDGYYREAVTSFSSSLERFYEFCVQVLMAANKVPDDLVSEVWKTKVSKFSERQLGAFIFLWTNAFKKVPETLSINKTKFRNEVVHQGKIPTKEQAINYGKETYTLVINATHQLRDEFKSKVGSVRMSRIYYPAPSLDYNSRDSSLCMFSILDPSCERDRENPETFDQILRNVEEQRQGLDGLYNALKSNVVE